MQVPGIRMIAVDMLTTKELKDWMLHPVTCFIGRSCFWKRSSKAPFLEGIIGKCDDK